LIIDAQRDVDCYIDLAEANDLQITAAAETHIRADFLGGVRQLVEKHDTQGYLSAMGGYALVEDVIKDPACNPILKQIKVISTTEVDPEQDTVIDVRRFRPASDLLVKMIGGSYSVCHGNKRDSTNRREAPATDRKRTPGSLVSVEA
jgi:hypothetical protein